MPHYLAPLFNPRSVAVIGARDDVHKVGGQVLANLLAAGFQGEVFAVNPRHGRAQGIACFASVQDLPRPVDLAVVVTPAPTVAGIIAQCGRAGIRAAVVVSAGFGEAGEEGRAREAELLAAAREHGVRLLGPNCLGIMRPPSGLNATFARGRAGAGSIALLSQSGAVCTAMVDWAGSAGIGFSSVISLGASSDVDFGEAIDYLACDEKTEHILLYMEGVRDGRRLVSSLRAAARSKPVIVMKAGRHPVGSRAAASHTGAIVGRDDVFEAVVRRTGIVRVGTTAELLAAAQALSAHLHPSGERLAIVTNGGGPGVMAADRAADLDIPLATLRAETLAKLAPVLPENWSHGNPLDLIGDAGPERYRAAIQACLEDPGVDGIVAILTPQAMTDADGAALAVIEATPRRAKPVICCWMGQSSVKQARIRLQQAGLPVFPLPEMAVEAFAYLAQFYHNQRLLLEAPAPLQEREPSDLALARRIVARGLAEGQRVLDATASKELLAAFRIPVVRSVDAAGPEEAVAAANAAGYPVVMKIRSPDITHKSDVGGVRLGLADGNAVRVAYAEMMAAVAAVKPSARVSGVSIETLVARPHSRELMVGIARDPVFGPAVTFGAGGIAVEVLRDRAVALPPLNAKLVGAMIGQTRVSRMLAQFRNLPAVRAAALEDVLLRVSEIACELPEVEELDVNPVVADEHGVLVLDARVVLKAVPAGARRYAHLAIHPYPSDLVTTETLRDGRSVVLRPIRPEDAALEMAFVDGLSPASRRTRFQSALRSLTPTMLARFTQVDYDREMALVAIDSSGAAPRQVAVGRYSSLPDGRSCEFAIVVADEWQRCGLGRRMMVRLIEVARARGLESMMGWVLSENRPMLEMVARLGFAIAADPEDAMMREVTLPLA